MIKNKKIDELNLDKDSLEFENNNFDFENSDFYCNSLKFKDKIVLFQSPRINCIYDEDLKCVKPIDEIEWKSYTNKIKNLIKTEYEIQFPNTLKITDRVGLFELSSDSGPKQVSSLPNQVFRAF